MRICLWILLTAAIVLVGATSAGAATIEVANAGFELPAQPEGFNTNYTPSGGPANPNAIESWTPVGSPIAGVYNPPAGVYNADTPANLNGGAPEGLNVAFSNSGGFEQTIADSNFDPLESYTLEVLVGDRNDTSFGGYTITLFAGSSQIAASSSTSSGAVIPPDGTFVNIVTQYVPAATVLPTVLQLEGEPLTIRLSANRTQINFDDVRLTTTDVLVIPEPLAAGSAGLLGLVALRRRR
jgi:hypothetical protein